MSRLIYYENLSWTEHTSRGSESMQFGPKDTTHVYGPDNKTQIGCALPSVRTCVHPSFRLQNESVSEKIRNYMLDILLIDLSAMMYHLLL